MVLTFSFYCESERNLTLTNSASATIFTAMWVRTVENFNRAESVATYAQTTGFSWLTHARLRRAFTPQEQGPNKPQMLPEKRAQTLLSSKLTFEDFIDHLRVRFALHRLHGLAHEKAEKLVLASLILLNLVGICSENLVNNRLNRARIALLL